MGGGGWVDVGGLVDGVGGWDGLVVWLNYVTIMLISL